MTRTLGAFLLNHTFGKADQLGFRTVRLPKNTPVIEDANNYTVSSSSNRFYSITNLPIGGLRERLDDFYHSLPIQHACDAMGDRRHYLTARALRQFREDCRRDLASDVSKGIAALR